LTATDLNGGFFVGGIPPGTYDVEVKENRRVGRIARSMTLAPGPNTRAFGDLLAGDVDAMTRWRWWTTPECAPSYGRCTGDVGYEPRADFTGDNCVLLADYARLRANYGVIGPLDAP
jgi:hypothetical protein